MHAFEPARSVKLLGATRHNDPSGAAYVAFFIEGPENAVGPNPTRGSRRLFKQITHTHMYWWAHQSLIDLYSTFALTASIWALRFGSQLPLGPR